VYVFSGMGGTDAQNGNAVRSHYGSYFSRSSLSRFRFFPAQPE